MKRNTLVIFITSVVGALCCCSPVVMKINGSNSKNQAPSHVVTPSSVSDDDIDNHPILAPSVSPSPRRTLTQRPKEPLRSHHHDDDDNDNDIARGVTPGAFCSTRNAIGYTKTGRKMTCKGPEPLRWRS